ncbi:Ig-like domain-containing protein [Nocardioides sp. Bht2]|uniref:Ig-like domain-containing protein n=1 Tax=Nocardioides sp. Bht2 TaxID=3392297 RepID=UPI0039B6B732
MAGAGTLPLAAQLPASFADPGQPAVAKVATTSPTVVCAAKRGGEIRIPAAGSCKGGERKVTVTVAKRTAWCLAKKGAVTQATSSKQVKACKRTRGNKVTVPSNTTLTLCARTDRAARWVQNSAKCRGKEKRRVFVNAAPTGLGATGLSVVDGAPVGAVAATLAARDANVGDKLTFRLSAGGADNAAFTISGQRLLIKSPPDMAVKPQLSVKVEARDLLGRSVVRVFAVQVAPLPVSDLVLNPARIAENSAPGTSVGRLSAAPASVREAQYRLISGAGDADNASFTISGDELLTAVSFDHEATPSATVRVEVTRAGVVQEQALEVQVTDVNEEPTGFDLSVVNVPDGAPAGFVVGTAQNVIDPDADEQHTFAVVVGDDNFTMVGTELRTTRVLTPGRRAATVRVTDRGGAAFEKLVSVKALSDAEIVLTPSKIDENSAAGTTVGELSAPNAETGESYDFTVVSGPATTVGNELRSSRPYDHETEPTISVIVSADNGIDAPVVETLVITVDDVDEAPVIAPDTYTGAIGNTSAALGLSVPAPTVTLVGALPLANDVDPEGGPLSVVAANGLATSRGGSASVDSQGRFSYRPPLGARGGEDSFVVQVTDGTHIVPETITIGLRDVAVWYVDAAASAGGTGSAWAPLTSLSTLSGALDADAPGDVIRIAAGSPGFPAAGLVLEAGQSLVGAGEALVVDGVTLLPAGGVSTLAGAATGALVQLAQGSRVAGLTITPTGTGAALSANNVNAATVESSVMINGAGGRAVTVTGGGGNLDVLAPISLPSWTAATSDAAVAVSGRTSGTVRFAAISTKAGQFSGGVSVTSAVTGSTVAFTGAIGLRTDTRPAFSASGGTIRWEADNTLVTTTGTPLTLQNVSTAGTSAFTTVSSSGAPSGIVASGVSGTGLKVTGGTIASSTGDGVRLTDLKSAITLQGLTINGSVGDGVHVDQGTGTGTLTLSNSQFAGNLDDHIQVIARANGVLNPVQIQNNILVGNTVGAWGQGIVVENDTGFSGQLRYSVTGNTLTGAAPSAAAAIFVSGLNSVGVLSGTVANNKIGTVASPCSPLVDGIRIANDQGSMVAVVRVADNTIVGCRTGIRLRAADGAAALHATVVNNNVGGRDPSAEHGLSAEYGQLPTDSGASCLDVSGNTLAGVGNFPGLRVRKLHAFLRLPNYNQGGTDSVAVRNYLASRNPTTTAIDVSAPATGNFGNAVCQTPN